MGYQMEYPRSENLMVNLMGNHLVFLLTVILMDFQMVYPRMELPTENLMG